MKGEHSKTEDEVGLTEEDFEKIYEYLKVPPSKRTAQDLYKQSEN